MEHFGVSEIVSQIRIAVRAELFSNAASVILNTTTNYIDKREWREIHIAKGVPLPRELQDIPRPPRGVDLVKAARDQLERGSRWISWTEAERQCRDLCTLFLDADETDVAREAEQFIDGLGFPPSDWKTWHQADYNLALLEGGIIGLYLKCWCAEEESVNLDFMHKEYRHRIVDRREAAKNDGLH